MTSRELKTIRAQLGYTQQELATQLDVARNTVARWEMGWHPISRTAEHRMRLILTQRRPPWRQS